MKHILFVYLIVFVLSKVHADESVLWIFPATDQMVAAIKRVQNERDMEVHEILDGHGFGIAEYNVKLTGGAKGGDWRFEYIGVRINGLVFLDTLQRYQSNDDPKERGIFRTEDRIYGALIEHVEDPLFLRELDLTRLYRKRLKLFMKDWQFIEFGYNPDRIEQVRNLDDEPEKPGAERGGKSTNSDDNSLKNEGQQDGTGQPATRSQSKSEGSDKPQPEAEGRSR
jgi:hypothetical protein